MIGHGVPGLDIRQDYEFASTRVALFAALTLTLDAWWPTEARFFAGVGRLTLEPVLGGTWSEAGPGGAGCVLGVIDTIDPERRLYLNGWFGISGVVAGRVHFDLEETQGGTRLALLHQAIGPVPEDMNTRRRALWRRALDGSLRDHLRGTVV